MLDEREGGKGVHVGKRVTRESSSKNQSGRTCEDGAAW